MTERERGTGGLIKYSNSPYWYAQWYENGKQVRKSLGTASKQEARAKLNRLIGDRDAGLSPAVSERRLTYQNLRDYLLDDYRNQERKSLMVTKDGVENISGLEALDRFFKPKQRAVEIKSEDCDRFIRTRKKENIGGAYINRSLELLRRMFKLAVRRGKMARVPHIPFLKEPSARKGFVTREQFERIRAGLPEKLQPLSLLLFYTGVRLGEAKQIDWTQVNLDSGLIMLEGEQTKNQDARYLPMPDVLIELLKTVEPKAGPAFPATNFTKSWRGACVKTGLGQWRDAKDRDAGYDGIIPHDLRRSAIKQLVDSGVSESVAMKISGHKTSSVFRRYNIVTTDDVVRAMRRVQGLENKPTLSRLAAGRETEST